MITVNVNNTTHQLKENCSLQDAIHTLNISDKGIAVAINQSIITKTDWKTTILNNEDTVLIIQATQGG